MRIKDLRASLAGMRPISPGYGGMSAYGVLGASGLEGRNWDREAGARFDNSIVYAAISYITNGFMEMRPYVRRRVGDSWERVNNHPVERLLDHCAVQGQAPWYDGTTLESGQIVSELCGKAGMSYAFWHRSSAGRIIGVEYLPHYAVMPFTFPGSGDFISYYRVAVAGGGGIGYLQLDPSDVLAIRYGGVAINPYRVQVAVGPLEAILLEVVTDKQAALWTAALLSNVGVSAHYFKPAWKLADGSPGSITSEQWEVFKRGYEEAITGGGRGKPFSSVLPLDVERLGFSPSEMDLGAIRNIPEERISAALRIHPNTLYLGTGLAQANNRASAEIAEVQSARNCLKPYAARRSRQLTHALRGELLAPDEEVYYPASECLEALQEDRGMMASRLAVACGGPFMSVNEARQRFGLPETEDPRDGQVREPRTTRLPATTEDDNTP